MGRHWAEAALGMGERRWAEAGFRPTHNERRERFGFNSKQRRFKWFAKKKSTSTPKIMIFFGEVPETI